REPTQPLEVSATGAVQNAASTEEQEALHQHVAPEVEARRQHAESGDGRRAQRRAPPSDAQPDEDEPHVLDARVRQHPLEVALRERLRDAESGPRKSDQDERRPPEGGGRQEGERAEQTVKANL